MGKMGTEIGAYYNTPGFKKMNEALEDKYGIPHNHYNNEDELNDENYKKYQAELDSKIPASIKQETEELNKMGKQMSARYETPEFKEQNRLVQQLGDSLNKAYNNPDIKAQQKQMDNLSKVINSYTNNPDIKKNQELLNQAVKKLTAYVSSTTYQQYLKMAEDINFNFNFNNNDDKEKPEKPEKPGKPEKPASPDGDN